MGHWGMATTSLSRRVRAGSWPLAVCGRGLYHTRARPQTGLARVFLKPRPRPAERGPAAPARTPAQRE